MNTIGPTRPGPLVILGCVGAVLGFAIRPVSIALDVAEPLIPVWSAIALWLLALAITLTWWLTRRSLVQHRGRELEGFQAVNRLVLGKSSALVGAFLAGGYVGFAIAHVGVESTTYAHQRLLLGVICALAAALLLVSGVLLERACRVPPDGNSSLR